MPIEFSSLSSIQLKALAPSQTVFLFPVGILEDHGPHLPLNLDVAEAEQLSFLVAERLEKEMPGWTGVLMPSLSAGIDGNTTDLVLGVRAHVLRDWLVDSCRGLMRHGFLHFVCLSGTLGPKQLTAIEDAGKIVSGLSLWKRVLKPRSRRAYLASVSSSLVSGKQAWKSPVFPRPEEHGGKRDTSVALALGLKVDAVYSALIPSEALPRSVIVLGWMRWMRKVSGFWGKPSDATAAEGQRTLNGVVAELFPKLRAVLEGANPNMIFRSWYSVIPANKSFFKAWALAIGVLFLLLLFSIRDPVSF